MQKRAKTQIKVGFGFDIHRLVEGRKLIIAGMEIPHPKGLLGHSDGDVVLHAVCDAADVFVYARAILRGGRRSHGTTYD